MPEHLDAGRRQLRGAYGHDFLPPRWRR